MCVGVGVGVGGGGGGRGRGGGGRNIVILTSSLVIDESFCISDLIDKIYHYIEIRSMISWIVIMLLLILPKDIPYRPEGQNIVFCTLLPPPRYFDPLK